jgi:diguanylate cyclase (GGDEF) domain
MPILSETMFGTLAAQALGAVVSAILLGSFYREYRKDYLGFWAWGWLLLGLHYASSAAALHLAASGSAIRITLPLSIVSGVAGWLQLGFFLIGCHELARRRPPKLRTRRLILTLFPAMGALLAIAIAFAFDPSHQYLRYFTRIGCYALAAATVYFVAALWVWKGRAKRYVIGFVVLTVGFLLYGIQQVDYFAMSIFTLATHAYPAYRGYVGFADLLLQTIVAMGMIASLLEDEREAARLATVEIEHLAYHDALTGLPNRPLFIDRLIVAIAQAARIEQKVAVFFLDLDRFKDINDSLGHSVGDALLKEVAERIRGYFRLGDTVARFGGDEFTILIQRIDPIEHIAKIAQKLLDMMKAPFNIGGRELFVDVSIGISIYPADGSDAETLVRNADSAMYRAKEHGRDNYQLYAPAMNEMALERIAVETALRKALANDELVLFYQPLVDIRTRRITGFEALLRWQHPELGLLLPAYFISAAEMSGLIIPIGAWVLKTACSQAKSWQKRAGERIAVAVNLSTRQFQQTGLVGYVREALEESGLDPSLLELEITESNAMQNAENGIRTMLELKALGARISMDDFGTGYSSLSYLKRFPIDTLKLDQSFVRDITTNLSDGAIATAVIAMAHSLDMKVVAEGVETEAQLAFLEERACDHMQGFLFSKPLPPDAAESLLRGKEPKYRNGRFELNPDRELLA